MLNRFLRAFLVLLILALLLVSNTGALAAKPPSIEATIATLLDRLTRDLRPYQLRYLSDREVVRLLTPDERRILSDGHISFRVNVPVTVYIVRGASPRNNPFWLRDQSFVVSTNEWKIDKTSLKIFEREFDAGTISLGVNSFVGGGSHYVVVLAPKFPGDAVIVTDLNPPTLGTTNLHPGVPIYADLDDTFPNIPPQFAGYRLIQTLHSMRDDARIRDLFRWTDHPASDRPDQVTLTWSGDPKTTQTIQWRTAERVRTGLVRYAQKSGVESGSAHAFTVLSNSERVHTRFIVNNPVMRHHTVTLTNLAPGETYRYSVGDGTARNWSTPAEFTTAPATNGPFSFIYMGDAQTGLYRWGSLLRRAFNSHPGAAFYIVAGDLVNRGHERNEWDDFLYNARGVFDRRTFVPVIGNHDCIGGHPTLYLSLFELPRHGPPELEPERAYSFEYSNALFVVLDSNLDPKKQVAWLDQQLAGSKAEWKFVTFHHPAFSSAPERDNPEIRNAWSPILEKHKVDFVLQGHDHAYMRTHPISNSLDAKASTNGPIYLVSVSGAKMYKQQPGPTSAISFTNTPTYQVFEINSNHLTYRAYDTDGQVRDLLTLEKPR